MNCCEYEEEKYQNFKSKIQKCNDGYMVKELTAERIIFLLYHLKKLHNLLEPQF